MHVIYENFDQRNRIGLVVRNFGPFIKPRTMLWWPHSQHADVILPNGMPIGFYGDPQIPFRIKRDKPHLSVDFLKDAAWDFELMQRHRPQYVSIQKATEKDVVSTVLLINVTKSQAEKFTSIWNKWYASPDNFLFSNNNCSTHAYSSFVESGILDEGGISGTDTPVKLYYLLLKKVKSPYINRSGYIGFEPSGSGNFKLSIDLDYLKPK